MREGGTKPRIILYCDSPIAGGFEQLVGRLADSLATQGYVVELWYWHERVGGAVAEAGVIKRRLPFPTGMPLPFVRSLNAVAIWRVAQLLKATPHDLLVVCQASIENGARALVAARLLGIPAVSYLALALDLRTNGARLGHLREMVGSLFYRLPSTFITVSEFQRELVEARLDTPAFVIPMAIDVTEQGLPSPKGDATGTMNVGVVGAVAFNPKGQDVLPELASMLRARGTPARVHVVGDGPDLPRLRDSIRRRGLEGDFIIHGQLPFGAPREIMRTLDVLVIPSRSEGTVPLVAFEALAAGVPFVISALPSARDWHVPPDLQFDRLVPADIVRAIDAARRFRSSPAFTAFRTRMLATVSADGFNHEAARVIERVLSATRAAFPARERA